ncbi:MAG: group II intron reverse transcriptase/maturase [Chloroflexota bacterium]
MTINCPALADAPSHDVPVWHAIDWRKANSIVRRLQVRIVKAVKAGKRHKVRSLQRLLSRSFSGQVLAVKRVTENQGKNTPGVDGEIWDTPDKKAIALYCLQKRYFKAKPLKRCYIPKSNGKLRPLGIPCMIDRAYQALHLLALEPVAETTGDLNSYGFRKNRSAADAFTQLHIVLARRHAAQWILEGDIKACFDELSHDWLLTHIPTDKRNLAQWLKAGYMEKDVLYPTKSGSPQGGIISPVVANMALDGLEPLLRKTFPGHRGHKINLVRYADDFVITGVTREVLQEQVMPLVQAFLQERGLALSPEKTRITHISDGFDFLGQNIRTYNGKYLSKPSARSQKALLTKVRTLIKTEGRSLSAYGLIRRLNPIIRGWANYHRHAASKQTFQSIDNQIYGILWQWAKRRHRKKSKSWIHQQYFSNPALPYNGFHTFTVNGKGERIPYRLFSAARLPIRRHVKVRSRANPFDPQDELYFEERQYCYIHTDFWDKPWFKYLWTRERGICPVCDELITMKSGWHNHHIQWRVYGGSDELDNRILLHPNCHRQVHNPEYNGPPLRPSSGV